MSYADQIFIQTCTDIINNGTDTTRQEVRPRWEDGSPAYTIKKFGVCEHYDLRKEFPALTLRRTAIKSAMDEILWIYQKKSNNVHDLKSHIWDSWANESGSIGKAYGWQIAQKIRQDGITLEGLKKAFPNAKLIRMDGMDAYTANINKPDAPPHIYAIQKPVGANDHIAWHMDQMDRVLYDLKNTPYNRRIMTNTYNHADIPEMGLAPCAYSTTWSVTHPDGSPKPVLNLMLNQRSQDMLAASNWNVVQYSLLLMMVAQVCGMIAGEFLHIVADAHIYDKHVPIVKELIQREPYKAPVVNLNPNVTDFYDFTTDDVKVLHYYTHDQIKNIPIAV